MKDLWVGINADSDFAQSQLQMEQWRNISSPMQ